MEEEELEQQGDTLESDLKALKMVLDNPTLPSPNPLFPQGVGVERRTEQFRKMLWSNYHYQSILKDFLNHIHLLSLKNQEATRRVRGFIESGNKIGKKTTTRSFKHRFFQTPNGDLPPENPHGVRRNKHLEKLPKSFKFRRWNNKEKNHLRQGVREANKQLLFNRLMEEYHTSGKSVELFNIETQKLRSMGEKELEQNIEGLDWDAIAKNHVKTRKGIDCKIQWLQNMHPNINTKSFSKQEDKQLLALAMQYKGHNWELIAKELGTRRTPVQCFRRYQRSLNTNLMRSKWTKAEDEKLIEAVKRLGDRNWQQIAHDMEGRTGQQCLHRWQKTLNPSIARGKWSIEEDMRLALAVKGYANEKCKHPWIKIQRHVGGRTDVQCRERWVNILNPVLDNGPWSPAEDEKLQEAIKKHGVGQWSAIANVLAPRTDNQCWRRWKFLNAQDANSYSKTVYKRHKALVKNFAGREKERPQLTADDFELDENFVEPEKKKRRLSKEEAAEAKRQKEEQKRQKGRRNRRPNSQPLMDPLPLPSLLPPLAHITVTQSTSLNAQYLSLNTPSPSTIPLPPIIPPDLPISNNNSVNSNSIINIPNNNSHQHNPPKPFVQNNNRSINNSKGKEIEEAEITSFKNA